MTFRGKALLEAKVLDTFVFVVEEGEVVLRKAPPLDHDYLQSLEATLSEWNGEHDDEAYRDL